MASVNKVILVGNCGRDPEIRYLPSGQAVANVSVATSSRRKDKNTGETIEDTQWHRVTFYDRLAEIAGEYVKKGRPIYVEGRLKYGKYTDKDGVEKNTVDIIATEMQLLGGREGMGGPATTTSGGAPRRSAPPAPRPAPQRRPAPRQAPAKAGQRLRRHGRRHSVLTRSPSSECPSPAQPQGWRGFFVASGCTRGGYLCILLPVYGDCHAFVSIFFWSDPPSGAVAGCLGRVRSRGAESGSGADGSDPGARRCPPASRSTA